MKKDKSMSKVILIIAVIIEMMFLSMERAEAGSCDPWEGIPTITLRNPDKEVSYEKCMKEEGTSCTGGSLITIGIADVGKFHGDVCAGSSFGFRACQIAFAHLYPGEIPPRGDQYVAMNPERSCPTDAVSYITGARYGKGAPATGIRNDDLVFDATLPSFSFIFASMSSGKAVKLVSQFVLPKEFMDLRAKTFSNQATPEEKIRFFHMGRCLSFKILTAPEKDIFTVTSLPDFDWRKCQEESAQ